MCSGPTDMYHDYKPGEGAEAGTCIAGTGVGSCGLTKKEHEDFDYVAYDKWWADHLSGQWLLDFEAELEIEEATSGHA